MAPLEEHCSLPRIAGEGGCRGELVLRLVVTPEGGEQRRHLAPLVGVGETDRRAEVTARMTSTTGEGPTRGFSACELSVARTVDDWLWGLRRGLNEPARCRRLLAMLTAA